MARLETPPGNRAPTEAQLQAAQERREKQAFQQAAEQLRQAVQGDPALAGLSRQLAIDITPEGLRIQLLDEDRLPMFATGSATPNERIQMLLAKVAPVLMRLPEDIAVVGHTDAAPFAGTGKTNWELSTERANATRRLLTDAGLAESRISRVTGLADRDALLPADPLAAANRRIAIIVLRGTKKPAAPLALPSAPSPALSPAPSSAPSPAPSPVVVPAPSHRSLPP
jgi:chemotaxis protein MotB